MLEPLEEILNWVSDQDAEWWPFLFLRPRQDERMTTARVALLSLLYGAMFGVIANVAVAFAGNRVNPLMFPLCTTLVIFVGARLTFAWAWNRRAARLCPAVARRSERTR